MTTMIDSTHFVDVPAMWESTFKEHVDKLDFEIALDLIEEWTETERQVYFNDNMPFNYIKYCAVNDDVNTSAILMATLLSLATGKPFYDLYVINLSFPSMATTQVISLKPLPVGPLQDPVYDLYFPKATTAATVATVMNALRGSESVAYVTHSSSVVNNWIGMNYIQMINTYERRNWLCRMLTPQ